MPYGEVVVVVVGEVVVVVVGCVVVVAGAVVEVGCVVVVVGCVVVVAGATVVAVDDVEGVVDVVDVVEGVDVELHAPRATAELTRSATRKPDLAGHLLRSGERYRSRRRGPVMTW